MSYESNKHKFAKFTLVRWLREMAVEAGGHDFYAGSCTNYTDHTEWQRHRNDSKPLHWRVNRGAPNYGVWEEYPICLDKNNHLVGCSPVWDETDWDDSAIYEADPDIEGAWPSVRYKPGSLLDVRPPTYQETIEMGLTPVVIFDVAVQHKGIIKYGLEVVHTNDISPTKLAYLKRIDITTYAFDADWILSQPKRPEKIIGRLVVA